MEDVPPRRSGRGSARESGRLEKLHGADASGEPDSSEYSNGSRRLRRRAGGRGRKPGIRRGSGAPPGERSTRAVLTSVRIATRKSALALWQARRVADELARHHPGLEVELVGLVTEGDRNREPSLAKSGGKGLFVNALEEALADGRADVAVHSMKDVPSHLSESFALTTFGGRADPRDALVSAGGTPIGDLPSGAAVGTSSARRRALLGRLRRDLDIRPLRGNVDTRLAAVEAGRVDAAVLACAGLDRLGKADRIAQRLPPGTMTPAPGQGALGVEYLAERADVAELLAPGVEAPVQACVMAERRVTAALGGDCGVPVGVHCAAEGPSFRLWAVLFDAEGERELRVELAGAEPAALGDEAGRRLFRGGAGELVGSA